jgi:hypothetical protein
MTRELGEWKPIMEAIRAKGVPWVRSPVALARHHRIVSGQHPAPLFCVLKEKANEAPPCSHVRLRTLHHQPKHPRTGVARQRAWPHGVRVVTTLGRRLLAADGSAHPAPPSCSRNRSRPSARGSTVVSALERHMFSRRRFPGSTGGCGSGFKKIQIPNTLSAAVWTALCSR